MTALGAQDIIASLGLPDSCRVDQRIPKKLLLENGAPTAADRRLIMDAIDDVQWIAALKPNTIGVSEYRDTLREYLEIAVLSVALRGDVKLANVMHLAELVHRAVPYPVLLLQMSKHGLILSLAHKRWAQNESGKVVLDGSVEVVSLPDAMLTAEVESAFTKSLALTRQPQTNLHALYQGWMDCVQALLAARLTGVFKAEVSPAQALARKQAIADCERLEAEILRLRTQAGKEKQVAHQVDLNLILKRVQAELASARQQL